MADFASGKFECPASTGATTDLVTGLSFQPKALLLWANAHTAAGSAADAAFGWGFADGTTQAHWGVKSDDNLSTSDSRIALHNARCIAIPDVPTGLLLAAAFSSFTSDGFELNFSTVLSGADINFIAFGGDDVSVKVGSFSHPGSIGNSSVTGLGFAPDAVIFQAWPRGDGTGENSENLQHMGWMDASGGGCTYVASHDGQATANTKRFHSNTQVIRTFNQVASEFGAAEPESLDADGFTLDWTKVAGHVTKYLAISGVAAKVLSFNQAATDIAQAVTVTGFGGTPLIALMMTVCQVAADADAIQDHSRFGFGVGMSSGNERSMFMADRDGVGTTDASRNISASHIIRTMEADGADTIDTGSASLTSFTLNTMNLSWAGTDGTQREILCLAMGDVPLVSVLGTGIRTGGLSIGV